MPSPSAKDSGAKAAQGHSAQASRDQADLATWRKTYVVEMPWYRKDLNRKVAAAIAFHKSNGVGHMTFHAGRVMENPDPIRGMAEREAWDKVVAAWAKSMRRKGYQVKITLQEAHFPKPQQSGREWLIELAWPMDAPAKK